MILDLNTNNLCLDNQDIKWGYVLEVQIVDHCNLNCANCNHFSPIAKPSFLSIFDYRDEMILLKKKLPNLKRLVLIGGEPFLHPNLIEFCKISRQLFNDIEIHIITNGTLLDNKAWLQQLKELKIKICISKYPGVNENLVIDKDDFYDVIENNRLFFHQNLVDVKGQQLDFASRTDRCPLYTLPFFTLKDYKLYMCQMAAHIDVFNRSGYEQIPMNTTNYIDLRMEDNIDLEKFCYQNKDICRYCKAGDFQLWSLSNKYREEFIYNAKELYLWKYIDYYRKYVDMTKYLSAVESGFIESIEPYGENTQKLYSKRINGKIDIIIPFYNTTIDECVFLKNNLLRQTIINDCVIYLVSDSSLYEAEVFDVFYNSGLNVVFLKTQKRSGPGVARQIGVSNSYNPYIFFLDIDDLFISETGLEHMFAAGRKAHANLVIGCEKSIENNLIANIDDPIHAYLYERQFLIDHRIEQFKSFYAEDLYFHWCVNYYNPIIANVNENIYLYNLHNYTNISNDSIQWNRKLFLLAQAFFLANFEPNDFYNKKKEFFLQSIDETNVTEQFKLFCLYIAKISDKNNKDEVKEDIINLSNYCYQLYEWSETCL